MISSLKKVLLAVPLVAVACDPGMTIRQMSSVNVTADQRVTVQVKTTHPLIGETWYAPDDATVTNLSDRPITVTNVELIASGTTYPNKAPGIAKYPLTIPIGKTETLPVWFDLDGGVKRTFERTVEFRVQYRSGGKDSVSSAFMVGGPLDTKAP
jgi:hypothetical protein